MNHNVEDVMYYYNPKYPEYGIGELPILNIAWITSAKDGTKLYIHGVTSSYDIETCTTTQWGKTYPIYCPYEEDDDMFVYDLPGNRERILSFNREKLVEWWREDLKAQKNIMERRLEDIEECLSQK